MSKIMGRQVATIEERLFCDCGAEMKPTGHCLTSHPPLYPHLCSAEGCDYSEHVSGSPYPRQGLVPIGEWQETKPDVDEPGW